MIVDESADIEWAAKKCLVGKLGNFGQVCIAPDYVMIHESKVDQFIDIMREQIKVGHHNCQEPGFTCKVINEFHYRRLCGLLEDHQGEVVIGNANAHKDLNLQPTVILFKEGVDRNCSVMQEEIFGPILPVITYKKLDEVIRYVNREQEKPLVVYYFGKKGSANMMRILNETSSGAFCSNEVVLQSCVPEIGFGGVGHSGMGKYHGRHGFENFSNMKSVLAKSALNFAPFNQSLPPLSKADEDQAIQAFNKFGHTTQADFMNGIYKFLAAAAIITTAIVYRAEIVKLFQ